MLKIVKVGSQSFNNRDAADEFMELKEAEGFEHVVMQSNTPKPGLYNVDWGHELKSDEDAYQWEMRTLSQIYRKRDEQDAREFTQLCEQHGRRVAAQALASESGLKGDDAYFFEQGFCGVHARQADPRASGKEAVFRQGRIVWGSKEGQRLYRAESVKARSELVMQRRPAINLSGPIANGEY